MEINSKNETFDLSIVVVGRNDDHGIGFFDRMVACMEFNRKNLLQAGVNAEFIFVDWAYDPGKPLFAQLLRDKLPWWHTAIAVHPDWQERLKENPRLAFLEFFAKNVGIRRARSEFILATNCDIFFSKDLVRFLGRGKWLEDCLYRSVRIDLLSAVGIDKIDYGILERPESVSFVRYPCPPYYDHASGDMQFMSRKLWFQVGGYNERVRFSKIHKDSNLCACVELKHQVPLKLVGSVYHFDHEMSYNENRLPFGPRNETAPYGPDWDWEVSYENPPHWGLGDQEVQAFPGDPSVFWIDYPN
ncbi:MAG: hypothetical protein G3M78_07975 [Candidatus Nitrohelix vancouverensis]|uniref:Glycosyltransferase n=1 Tax=Candidatus Nitrohelix vancouverensis TaxID=2705534 RepID=A0A7T0G3E6_9BACT|nr:MAG: hypothetical protein G3M78_07975 [Candidatus Nitrohelix vancouverensis]